ncbi:unnamed protein product [Adineta ricciae]|uniref:SHSP domain-containing protein n=1 Tax=Adineta ricciae TaxID=249248 RepID=A0A815MPJ7_ADIRI|nr:unnamed protein product [Adineta ricciae]CAF1427433.1 unnamed protein product [Adineta ricciae]
MPFLYPPQATPFPVLVIASQSHADEEEDEDEDFEDDYLSPPSAAIFSSTMPIPMRAVSHTVHDDEHLPLPMINTDDDPRIYRLRMHVDGFQPNELNVSIRHSRLIVRGKHVVCVPPHSSISLTDSTIDGNDDIEPDFVAKEFKRTFTVPPNADVRKAHAQFYPQQQLLVIEIPFQNCTNASAPRSQRSRIRPIDVFLMIVTILFMERALRITYEQFMLNEPHFSVGSSQLPS